MEESQRKIKEGKLHGHLIHKKGNFYSRTQTFKRESKA
jgi:hypothetical protein